MDTLLKKLITINNWLLLKKVLKKSTKLWNEIENQIETINGVTKPIKYGKDFMKITFESDDNLPLKLILNIPRLITVTRTISQKNNKYYPQVYLQKWVIKMLQYEKITISEGTHIHKSNKSKECILYHYWYFKDVRFKSETNVCNKCHDVLMTAYELKNIANLNVQGVDHRCVL